MLRYLLQYVTYMKITITKRPLKDKEIDSITNDIKNFPFLGYLHKNYWMRFQNTFVVSKRNEFIGVCVVLPLKHWKKIGPVVISSKFQNKGYGKILLTYVTNYYKHDNLYIGSANPQIWKLAGDLGFQGTRNIFQVPLEIHTYLFIYLWNRFSILFIIDAIKKKITAKHQAYYYFFKENA